MQVLRDELRDLASAEASAKRMLEAETQKYARKAASQLQQVGSGRSGPWQGLLQWRVARVA